MKRGDVTQHSSDPLDKVDRKLLLLLAQQGRLTHQALSDAIGRSPTVVARRQRVLEERGLITGYRATVDLGKLGHGVTVFIKMTLAGQSKADLEAFEQAIMLCPSAVHCCLMSGVDDYLVTVRVASLAHFAEVHREELSALPGVVRMESGFVLKEVVPPRLPLHIF